MQLGQWYDFSLIFFLVYKSILIDFHWTGLSCEQSFSPTRIEDIEDVLSLGVQALKRVQPLNAERETNPDASANVADTYFESDMLSVTSDSKAFNTVDFVKEEVIEYEEATSGSVSLVSPNSSTLHVEKLE